MNDTIAAISTPIGKGAIGIVRMSGVGAQTILSKIFRPSRKKSIPFIPYRIYHGHIRDPLSKQIIDEVLVSVMVAPKSYTTEDVVEINSHSNQIIMERILFLLITQGARLAEPGEFTLRAFMGGRINLTQAEAVADIINAKSQKALEVGQKQLKGALGLKIKAIYNAIMDSLKWIEIGIDFPDESTQNNNKKALRNLKEKALGPIDLLLESYEQGMILRHGIRVAIVGETNVGKSSLLNRITNTEKVIVSEFHGTTRDSIDCDINIDGIPVQITDTAGIRKSSDPVENIGIQKAKEVLGKAHLVLIVTDVQKPSIPEEVYHLVDPEQICIWIVNKIDLWSNQEELEFKSGQPESCLISAKYEKGIQALKNEIKNLIFENRMDDQEIMSVPNTRHKNNLESARTSLLEARNKIKNDHPEELVAMDVRDAATHIQEIIGSRVDLDLVEIIFRDFCVGK